MIDVISFTGRGAKLSFKIKDALREDVGLYTGRKNEPLMEQGLVYVPEPLEEWTKSRFENKIPMIFIGAAGIAVRAIAPHVSDKMKDPPVIVMDEAGQFVIPLLSAHCGGGITLTEILARELNATPVITTATDVNGLFAVDCFARDNKLAVKNKDDIKKVSSELLSGRRLSVKAEGGCIKGPLPEELELKRETEVADIVLSVYESSGEKHRELIRLFPRAVHLGIGCRAGKTAEEIEEAVKSALSGAGISPLSLCRVASVDLKAGEEGLRRFAEERKLPFITFSAEELKNAKGDFDASTFVAEITGVDNVCERAAWLSAFVSSGDKGAPELVIKKSAGNGITVAAACEAWEVCVQDV
ncbi:MAG: cobalamin biosynthesis protein [Lachnospiraceae bacterium]|nr:cobalamin biosynthesis protein [Lachnospiraceae bacterium]